MRTIHFGLRVADLGASLAFYRALGYEVVGTVPETALGRLTMIKLPGDPFVAIELVSDGPEGSEPSGSGLSHLVVAVESMAAVRGRLAGAGIAVDAPTSPDGTDELLTAWTTDPDGNRIELVQWPPGHAEGMSAADWEG